MKSGVRRSDDYGGCKASGQRVCTQAGGVQARPVGRALPSAPQHRHREARSDPWAVVRRHGLPRRCAPRNDGFCCAPCNDADGVTAPPHRDCTPAVIARHEAIHGPLCRDMDCHGAVRLAMTGSAARIGTTDSAARLAMTDFVVRLAKTQMERQRPCTVIAPPPSSRGTKRSMGR